MRKLTWKEEILAGMELISKGCEDNTEWNKCKECPFDPFCDPLYRMSGGATPVELFLDTLWNEGEEE